jgi:DHA2 family multidrug resistance protein
MDDLTEYGHRRLLIVVGIMSAVLLEILDTTIVNVALPTLQGNMGADLEQSSWVVTGYLIAVIIALPLVPWFESILGRKRYCVTAILGFTAASCLCGTAQSLDALVAFRILQGLFGGGILTIARAILRDTFPPEQIGRSQGLLALGAVVGPSIGPTLGGLLTDNFSWRWIFFINVIPGIASAALLWRTLRDPRRQQSSSDVPGLLLMCTGLGSLQYVLETGQRHDWFSDTRIVVFAILALVSLIAFCLWELWGARHPIVDLSILRRPAIAWGVILSFGIGFTLFVGIVLGPQFTQSILGFTATMSGNVILIRALAIAAAIPIVVTALARLKVAPRYLLAAGFTLVGIAGILMSGVTTTTAAFWSFGPALAIGGLGFGCLFVPLSVAVLTSVGASESSKASSMLSLFQQLGASFSTGIMVTIIERRAAFHFDALAATITPRAPAIHDFLFLHHGTIKSLYRIVEQQAITGGFADANFIGGVLAFAMVPVALTFKRRHASAQATPRPMLRHSIRADTSV